MVLIVGQACNFKCKMCSNFAPFSPVEYRRYEVDEIISNLHSLICEVNHVDELQIQGGEPFIYSDLDKLVKWIGKRNNVIRKCVIATNGSIVPKDCLLDILKENGVVVRISNYGRTPDTTERLIKKLNEHEIENLLYNFTSGNSFWYDCGNIDVKRDNNKVSVRRRFQDCRFNTCLTLERGELNHCSRATNSYVLQNFKRTKDDYVNLSDKKGLRYRLSKYIYLGEAMTACAYCYGTDEKRLIPVAEQIE